MFVQPKKNISVLISDNHTLVSEQVVNLGILSDLDIVALVDKGEKAVEAFFRLKPDIALINYRMRYINGIETTRMIREVDPEAAVILFADQYSPQIVTDAIRVGARGVCLSNTSTKRIRVGIDCVVRGEVWVDEEILNPLLSESVSTSADPMAQTQTEPAPFKLSEREINVLTLVSNGYSNKRIASELYISVETVKSHLRRIMDRLSASDRTEAAVKAVRANLL